MKAVLADPSKGRSISIGAVLPSYDLGSDPVAIRDYAQAAEDLGFDRLIGYDHVLGFVGPDFGQRGYYDETVAFHEPLTLFSYLAGVTSRIGFLSGILILPLRQTVLVAKQAAELAILSAGRLELGVGLGSTPVEYEAMGVDYARRGERITEQIDLMRRLWMEDVVDFDGEFHRVDRAAMSPRPPAPISILFGGASEKAYRRALRIGDGFLLMASTPDFHEAGRHLVELRSRQGRTAADFAIHAMVDCGIGPERVHAELEGWREEGAASVSVRTTDRDAGIFGLPGPHLETIAEHIRALELFAEAAA